MGWSEYDYAQYLRRSGQAANDDTPEKVLVADIRALALPHGWLFWHCYDSRRTDEGFPDVVLVREAVIFAECKRNSITKPTHAQETWLTMLTRTRQVEVYFWQPRHWPEIAERLTRRWRAA